MNLLKPKGENSRILTLKFTKFSLKREFSVKFKFKARIFDEKLIWAGVG